MVHTHRNYSNGKSQESFPEIRTEAEANKMSQRVGIPASKPDDLGLMLRTHMKGRKELTHRLASDLHLPKK